MSEVQYVRRGAFFETSSDKSIDTSVHYIIELEVPEILLSQIRFLFLKKIVHLVLLIFKKSSIKSPLSITPLFFFFK